MKSFPRRPLSSSGISTRLWYDYSQVQSVDSSNGTRDDVRFLHRILELLVEIDIGDCVFLQKKIKRSHSKVSQTFVVCRHFLVSFFHV